MIVGTLGKALGAYGAYVACDATMAQYLVNCARPLIFSTALPPTGGRRGARGPRPDRRRARSGSTGCWRPRRRPARRVEVPRVSPCPDSGTQIVPIVVGDPGMAMTLCEAVLDPRRVRAGDPPADRAGGHVPVAARRDGVAPAASELREAARVIARTARRLGVRAPSEMPAEEPEPVRAERSAPTRDARPAPARERRQARTVEVEAYDEFEVTAAGIYDGQADAYPGAESDISTPSRTTTPSCPTGSLARPERRRALRGLFVTGTDTGVGKTILAAAIVAALRGGGARVGAFKPVLTGTDEPAGDWPRDHDLLASIAAPARTRSRRCASARRSHRTWRRARGQDDRPARAGPLGERGSRGCGSPGRRRRRRAPRPAHPGILRARPGRRTRATSRRRGAARPRDHQPHAPHGRSRARRRPGRPRRRPHPLAHRADGDGAIERGDDRKARGRRGGGAPPRRKPGRGGPRRRRAACRSTRGSETRPRRDRFRPHPG